MFLGIWHLGRVSSRVSSKTKANTKASKKKSAQSREVTALSKRLSLLEDLLELVLKAALRGRILPSERQIVKRYLETRRNEQASSSQAKEIQTDDSEVKVFAIRTNEELVIALDTKRVIQEAREKKMMRKGV